MVIGYPAHSSAEVEREMKATIVLVVLVALAMVALAAQPATTPVVTHVTAAAQDLEPAWMVLSGAALIVIASVLRRMAP